MKKIITCVGFGLALSPLLAACGNILRDEAIASCSDGEVCTEILDGDGDAFQAQCALEGNTASSGPCSGYDGGPVCEGASITSVGEPVTANIYWNANYCSDNPNIDTYTTCVVDLSGSASGSHCTAP